MYERESARGARLQFGQRRPEHDRAFIAIGIEQRDRAARTSQHNGFQNRIKRRDAAASRQQHIVVWPLQRRDEKTPLWRQHRHAVPCPHRAVEMIGNPPRPFNRNLNSPVRIRRAGERVGTFDIRIPEPQAHRDELSRSISEAAFPCSRDFKNVGAGRRRGRKCKCCRQGRPSNVGRRRAGRPTLGPPKRWKRKEVVVIVSCDVRSKAQTPKNVIAATKSREFNQPLVLMGQFNKPTW